MNSPLVIHTDIVSCPICGSDEYIKLAAGIDFEYETCGNVFEYVKCSTCKVIYLKNRPSLSAIDIIYPDTYYAYNLSDHKKSLGIKIKSFIEIVKVKKYLSYHNQNPTVFDLGSGDGRILELFEKAGVHKNNLFGVELNSEAGQKACNKGYQVFKGLFEEMPLPRQKMDIVIINQVIEHSSDPMLLLKKVFSMMSSQGVVIIETVNCDSLDYYLFSKSYWGGYHIPRHWTLFDRETLSYAMEKEGFTIISKKNMLSPVFWILSFHNFFKQHNFDKFAKKISYMNPVLLMLFTLLDLCILPFKLTSNMQIIGMKQER